MKRRSLVEPTIRWASLSRRSSP
uniref:Uncharacterized protein n=1 Tax=Arundo donax TaxID=35708 RepID=A0A0A8YYA7_ARUDO